MEKEREREREREREKESCELWKLIMDLIYTGNMLFQINNL